MLSGLLQEYVRKHVTVITPISNQPITEIAAVQIFSGFFERTDGIYIELRLVDGSHALFREDLILGLVENLTLEEQPTEE